MPEEISEYQKHQDVNWLRKQMDQYKQELDSLNPELNKVKAELESLKTQHSFLLREKESLSKDFLKFKEDSENSLKNYIVALEKSSLELSKANQNIESLKNIVSTLDSELTKCKDKLLIKNKALQECLLGVSDQLKRIQNSIDL